MMWTVCFVLCSIFFSGGEANPEVKMPSALHTPIGSCLYIPCSFTTTVELKDAPQGRWWRNSLWSVYTRQDTSTDTDHLEPKVKVLGDLLKKNCTSIMLNLSSVHSDRYYFRLESKTNSITHSKSVNISVKDFWPKPVVNMQVLKEGEQTNLTCTSPAPCPSQLPRVTWSSHLAGSVTNELQMNSDGTHRIFSTLSFVSLQQHEGLVLSCVSTHPLHAEGRLLSAQTSITLNVHYAPKQVLVLDPGWVWSSSMMTLSCSSQANPPAELHRWFRLRNGQVEQLNSTSHQVSIPADNGLYICEVQNSYGRVNSTGLQIEVLGLTLAAFYTTLGICTVVLMLFIVLITQLIRRFRRPPQPERKEAQVNPFYENRRELKNQCTSSNENIYANC